MYLFLKYVSLFQYIMDNSNLNEKEIISSDKLESVIKSGQLIINSDKCNVTEIRDELKKRLIIFIIFTCTYVVYII